MFSKAYFKIGGKTNVEAFIFCYEEYKRRILLKRLTFHSWIYIYGVASNAITLQTRLLSFAKSEAAFDAVEMSGVTGVRIPLVKTSTSVVS